MSEEYLVVLKAGVDKADYISQVGEITVPQPHRPRKLICTLSEMQKLALESDINVEDICDYRALKNETIIENCATRDIEYYRMSQATDSTSGSAKNKGNYGLVRHTSQINNVSVDTEHDGTYTYEYDGTGVDLILNLASVLDLTDPEFMTSGATRINQFQWNTLPNMGDVPTVNYAPASHPSNIDEHAEAVAYITAGNTYGWASGASIYIMPRDQIDLWDYGWDCMRLFHENKGNNRPTVVVDAITSLRNSEFNSKYARSIIFRDDYYTEIAPAGSSDRPINAHSDYDANSSSLCYGCTNQNNAHPLSGKESNTNWRTSDAATIMSEAIAGYPRASDYTTYIEPIEDMIEAGVHHISAAGNNAHAIHISGHPDYNNAYLTNFTYTDSTIESFEETPQDVYMYQRPPYIVSGDTIAVGAMASRYKADEYDGKETLTGFSCRGTRVDCVAAGDKIFMDLHVNGYYEATGTSFASPQIGGMACLVLEKYPTTTPAQLRKYFRDHAVGTDTLYDSGIQPAVGSKHGDPAYFLDWAGLKGYSGNIAYLDPDLTFDPTTITDTSITVSEAEVDNTIDYTTAEINTKLGTI